ncbi:MAG: copper homeostasis protein CutC [Chloroflexi bacterium]|nr:copper homeostasis protein CutC [Chloroflexota bacterium]MCC6894674.1 copper homeostasis protein CutC [Anaerolineae bacterium]
MTTLEIAVTTVEDAVNAAEGGAESVELSFNLAMGGLTPTNEMIMAVRSAISIPLYVILRPQGETFRYTEAEVTAMMPRLEHMKRVGIEGVVFGAVDDSGVIDVALMKMLVAEAAPLPVTLHRALDMSREPEAALAALAGIVPRVLTSGPAATAWEGREGLRGWIEQFGEQYTVVSSGSLTVEQLAEYIRLVQPDTVHLGSAARTNGVVNVEKVRQLKVITDASGG